MSSDDQKPDLDRQVARLSAWAGEQGIPVGRVVTEVGSALNGERRTFLALLRDPDVTTIVVEHRDRFRTGHPAGAGRAGGATPPRQRRAETRDRPHAEARTL
jgi:predicted site-specific integrase-resolvase